MQYNEFNQLYPFLNARLINWASARIAGTSEYLESEARSRITYLNWKLNDRRINAPVTRRFLAEFPNGFPVSGIDEMLAGDEEFKYLHEQLLEAKYSLGAIKASTITPTKIQIQQAVEEVKDYITALHTPSIETFLQWNQRLSGREKYFLQSVPKFLRSASEDNLGKVWTVATSEWGYLNVDGYTALAEPVSQSFFDDDRLIAAITRNSYGCLCLNAPTTMFVDIDFDTDDVPLDCLPWGKQPKGLGIKEQIAEEKLAIAKTTKAWGLRFEGYRTFNGLRLIEMSREWDAQNAESTAVLEALGCDRLFQKLCKTQRCYRARLTPKPWRGEEEENSVCHYFGSFGSAPVNPIAAKVKTIHDSWCLGNDDLA